MILSPHFDDAVLSCWSVLTGASHLEVVNVFTRAPAGPSRRHEGEMLTGARDPAARARQRAIEDREALALVGARIRNLELLESSHWSAGVGPVRRRLRAVAGRLLPVLGEERRRLRECAAAMAGLIDRDARYYAPAALGGHPDHAAVRELGCMLLRQGVRVSFYADQPYCYAYGWPHWVVGGEPDPYLDVERYWKGHLDSASVSIDAMRPGVVRLDGAHEDKVRALRLYRTQFSVLEGGANRRVSNPALTGWEVFWHA